ncbi:hypothetical protein EVJ58_g7341 [Rhodofomes roseus]|uniref:F-box domain-containing protein n=1 Tax=Rhodofomes roseus TaxID=34475 RepID=A0A4Y9Y4S1_9APHY|nr:hypothetical protein EVJ58_g7341 [Rhodofomes roseus]
MSSPKSYKHARGRSDTVSTTTASSSLITTSSTIIGIRRESWDPMYREAGTDAPARTDWLKRLTRIERELGKSGAKPVRPTARGELPIDIWERVLNEFQDDLRVLFACACVCRAWYSHASKSLPRIDDVWELAGRADVMRVARVFGWEYPSVLMQRKWRAVVVRGSGPTHSLAHLKTFAAALAKQLRRIDELEVHSGVWMPGAVDAPTFARFSMCIALSRLTLHGVTFPSTTIVAKLVCALPNLARLSIVDVKTVQKRRGQDLCLPHGRPLQLRWLLLDSSEVCDVIEFLARACITRAITQATLVVRAAEQGRQPWSDTSCYPIFLEDAIALERLTIELRDRNSHNLSVAHTLSLAASSRLKEIQFVLYHSVDSKLMFRDCSVSLLAGMTSSYLRKIDIKFVVEDKPGMSLSLPDSLVPLKSSAACSEASNPQLRLMKDLTEDLDLSALDNLLSNPQFASDRLVVIVSLDYTWPVRDSYAIWRQHVERQLAKTRDIRPVFVWVETGIIRVSRWTGRS